MGKTDTEKIGFLHTQSELVDVARELIYYNKVDKGGHYAAWEQPQLFSGEVRAAFRPLRKQ